ncbi:hypothetical protein ACERJO_14265 [Halalkalibacter sp. AB-rgal2]|uniref:hypothetical protein n=1 Tax=Halalkalibacter sp. AB-rgal2 TaxID=3242695 RepID=UPI00359EEF00
MTSSYRNTLSLVADGSCQANVLRVLAKHPFFLEYERRYVLLFFIFVGSFIQEVIDQKYKQLAGISKEIDDSINSVSNLTSAQFPSFSNVRNRKEETVEVTSERVKYKYLRRVCYA